jgi:predicted PurR-regulated permease PerM
MGEAMRMFLGSQLIAMCLVGVLIGAGMWIIGVPSPAALGVIAGMCEFVPLIGPVVGAIPSLLMAFGQGTQQALLALAVVIVVQQLEANLIMPIIMRRTVAIGAAAGIFSVLVFGTLFGVTGVIFGYPLAIVLDTGIRRLYLRETLREPVKIVSEESLEKRRQREE